GVYAALFEVPGSKKFLRKSETLDLSRFNFSIQADVNRVLDVRKAELSSHSITSLTSKVGKTMRKIEPRR
ncbi:MAG: hypothetical protein WA728_03580, partial [Xanthobacteraceae bacterium]